MKRTCAGDSAAYPATNVAGSPAFVVHGMLANEIEQALVKQARRGGEGELEEILLSP